nr:hypothetical protein [Tanacetum cinerariifolium]
MLIGCTKLENLCINLYEKYLTDVGLGFIGKYGINLRSLSLACIGGSDEGLRALSKGCSGLRKFRMQGCDFSEQAITNFLLNVKSLRYLWVLDKDFKIVSALRRPNFGSSTMQAQVLLFGVANMKKSFLNIHKVKCYAFGTGHRDGKAVGLRLCY